jgi:hypothetical protein
MEHGRLPAVAAERRRVAELRQGARERMSLAWVKVLLTARGFVRLGVSRSDRNLNGLFPLTLSLSLGERGNSLAVLGKTTGRLQQTALLLSPNFRQREVGRER